MAGMCTKIEFSGSFGSELTGARSIDLSCEFPDQSEDELADFADAEESRESLETTSSEPVTLTLLDRL